MASHLLLYIKFHGNTATIIHYILCMSSMTEMGWLAKPKLLVFWCFTHVLGGFMGFQCSVRAVLLYPMDGQVCQSPNDPLQVWRPRVEWLSLELRCPGHCPRMADPSVARPLSLQAKGVRPTNLCFIICFFS